MEDLLSTGLPRLVFLTNLGYFIYMGRCFAMAGRCPDDSKLSRLAELLAGEEESSKDWKIGVWAVGTPLSAGQDGYVRKCTVDSVKCAILYGVPSSLYCSRGHALTLGNT